MDYLELIKNLNKWKVEYETIHDEGDSIFGIKITDKFNIQYIIYYIGDLFDKTEFTFDSINILQTNQSPNIIIEGETIYFTKSINHLKAVVMAGRGNSDFHYYSDIIIPLNI